MSSTRLRLQVGMMGEGDGNEGERLRGKKERVSGQVAWLGYGCVKRSLAFLL